MSHVQAMERKQLIGKLWKEAVTAYFKLQTLYMLGPTFKIQQKLW
jgi:hypothetical protein